MPYPPPTAQNAPADTGTAIAADGRPTDGGGDIVVYGSGKVRQEQTVGKAAIDILPPGSSPLRAVARLPGVALQSSDPFGSYELGTRLSVRGFNQSQMGYTLDGVPLGDMFYNNHNGLHISRAIASENISRVDVSQGAGSLAIASTSNLGGNLEFVSRAPFGDARRRGGRHLWHVRHRAPLRPDRQRRAVDGHASVAIGRLPRREQVEGLRPADRPQDQRQDCPEARRRDADRLAELFAPQGA